HLLTFRESNDVLQATVAGNVTDQKLATAMGGYETAIETYVEKFKRARSDYGGAEVLFRIYAGLPRNLTGHEHSGQSFTSKLSLDANLTKRPRWPLELQVAGVAKQAYSLRF